VSERLHREQVKVPLGSVPKEHTRPQDGARASGAHDFGYKRAGAADTSAAQDVKMEALVDYAGAGRHADC